MPKPPSQHQRPFLPAIRGRLDLATSLALVFFAALLLGLGYQWGNHRSSTQRVGAAPATPTAFAPSAPAPATALTEQAPGQQARPALDTLLGAAPVPGLGTVAYSRLPAEGQDVLTRIVGSYDFDHSKDGTVFGNRERILPQQQRGYYREYTVPTPGLDHRGARRLVCGGPQPRAPDHCFYTADHYASFRQVVH